MDHIGWLRQCCSAGGEEVAEHCCGKCLLVIIPGLLGRPTCIGLFSQLPFQFLECMVFGTGYYIQPIISHCRYNITPQKLKCVP